MLKRFAQLMLGVATTGEKHPTSKELADKLAKDASCCPVLGLPADIWGIY